MGVVQEAGTYAVATPAVVQCTTHPDQLILIKCSGAATAGTALADETDGNLLVQTSASKTVITDSDVGTSDFIGGYAICYSGNNLGEARIITSHSDNTSETVNQQFTNTDAVGDQYVRTFGPGNQGVELTTDFIEANMKPGAGVNLPDTGHFVVVDVFYYDARVDQGALNSVKIRNESTPVVFISARLIDHAWNSVA